MLIAWDSAPLAVKIAPASRVRFAYVSINCSSIVLHIDDVSSSLPQGQPVSLTVKLFHAALSKPSTRIRSTTRALALND